MKPCLSILLLLVPALALAAPPDPGAVARYVRFGPWNRNEEREVPKAEGDAILALLRDWETFEDLRNPNHICGMRPPPDIRLSAFPESGDPCDVGFRRSEDCDTGKTLLSVSFPGVWQLRVPAETADALLRQFDAWEDADRQAFLAAPFPRRYVLGSNPRDRCTLSGVAALVYGNGTQWRAIWNANRDSIPDPDRPVPGTELVIPALEPQKPDGIWEARIHDDIRDWPLPCQYVLGMDPRDGGTLSGVARLFYGDGGKWPVIWDANKDAVPDPDRPKPGTSLKIPALAEGVAP